jgi:HEAT repeat protein
MTLAKSATRATPNIEEGRTIAGQLAAMGPEALNPLFDVMADRASSPFAKTLATMSLVPVLDPRVAPRLLDLTKPENEVTTRVCATSLLGWIQQPEVDAALNELKNDKNRQVRFQALQGLAQKSLEGRKAFGDLWKQPDTTVDERAKIVSVLSNGPFTDSLPIFQEAAGDAKLGEPVRILAIQMLGRAGNPSSLPVLNECAEKDPNPQVQTTAKNAIDAVNKRAEDARALQPPKP